MLMPPININQCSIVLNTGTCTQYAYMCKGSNCLTSLNVIGNEPSLDSLETLKLLTLNRTNRMKMTFAHHLGNNLLNMIRFYEITCDKWYLCDFQENWIRNKYSYHIEMGLKSFVCI